MLYTVSSFYPWCLHPLVLKHASRKYCAQSWSSSRLKRASFHYFFSCLSQVQVSFQMSKTALCWSSWTQYSLEANFRVDHMLWAGSKTLTDWLLQYWKYRETGGLSGSCEVSCKLFLQGSFLLGSSVGGASHDCKACEDFMVQLWGS